MVIQNGKVTPPYGVATTVQWITAAHADGRAKIVSVEPVANGIVRLDDETEFENPVDRPELGAYAYVNTYDEKYSAPEVLRNSQVTNAKSPKEGQWQICHRHRSCMQQICNQPIYAISTHKLVIATHKYLPCAANARAHANACICACLSVRPLTRLPICPSIRLVACLSGQAHP